MPTLLMVYAGLGCVAGLLAGLLGVGGGIVIVPMLVLCLGWQKVDPEAAFRLATGTSFASILFTSLASTRAHHARGAVVWKVVRDLSPGIVAGTFLGSLVAKRLPGGFLKGFFAAFLVYVAVQMMLNRRPSGSRPLPGTAGMTATGAGIGAVSSLVGIGGGTMTVPFLLWCSVPVHQAVGTSAAVGFPIALAGALGYAITGWGAANRPPLSLGYIYLPALAGIVVASMLTAPLGARLAHRLPVAALKRAFAVLVAVMAGKLVLGLLK